MDGLLPVATVCRVSTSSAGLQRLREIAISDVIQLARLSVKMLRIELLLRTQPVASVVPRFGVNFLRSEHEQPRSDDPNIRYTPQEWQWVKNHKRIVKRWPWDKSCLRRSLLLGWILRHRDPDLMIGARTGDDGEIEAHAWIRLDGVDLDIESRSYTAF